MVCRVCSHPDRKKIDREIVAGGNLSAISRQYNISTNSIGRHKQGHIAPALARGAEVATKNHGVQLLESLDDLLTLCEEGIVK